MLKRSVSHNTSRAVGVRYNNNGYQDNCCDGTVAPVEVTEKRLFVPDFVPLPKTTGIKDTEERNIAIRSRAKAGKENISNFYSAVLSQLNTAPDRGEKLDIPDPSVYWVNIQSRPDILERYKDGSRAIEIKGFSTHKGQVQCSHIQAARYLQFLLLRLKEGETLPSVDYAIFKYTNGHFNIFECDKSRDKDSEGRSHKCDNYCLAERLSGKTLNLSVIPLNLLLGFFSSLEFTLKDRMNQASSQSSWNHQDYLYIRAGTTFSRLHGGGNSRIIYPIQNLQEFLDGFIPPKLREILVLDGLQMVREESPPLVCEYKEPWRQMARFSVNPFQIVRFKMARADERQWLRNFRRHHQKILKKIMGINNLEEVVHEPEF